VFFILYDSFFFVNRELKSFPQVECSRKVAVLLPFCKEMLLFVEQLFLFFLAKSERIC